MIVFFRLIYAVVDRNVAKNNTYFVTFVYFVCKKAFEILYLALQCTRPVNTASVNRPLSWRLLASPNYQPLPYYGQL